MVRSLLGVLTGWSLLLAFPAAATSLTYEFLPKAQFHLLGEKPLSFEGGFTLSQTPEPRSADFAITELTLDAGDFAFTGSGDFLGLTVLFAFPPGIGGDGARVTTWILLAQSLNVVEDEISFFYGLAIDVPDQAGIVQVAENTWFATVEEFRFHILTLEGDSRRPQFGPDGFPELLDMKLSVIDNSGTIDRDCLLWLNCSAFNLERSRVGKVSFSAIPVPEPATWVLLALGIGAVAVLRRRRDGPRRLL